ncbi:hypothetical protein G9C85_10900 [Halorubellus sp. JP-L1]|uniref:hypothetical protein n=1 Tax=Halorubellus sp. JP-L1 TaxID=2715753 RepID=UPI00140909DE|nr:hypothetical protein [Halorubellus sp. JP-L1]NHN42131.1 hypothetical protein [Halorubellus sp. JP-L1]
MTGSTHVRVALALVLAVSLAGCGAANLPFLGDDDPDDGEAERIAADAVGEMQSVSAYNFSTRQIVSFGQNELNVTTEGTVNHSSERLRMEVVESVETNTTRSKQFSTVYVVGDTRCRSVSNDESEWNVTAGADAWNGGLSPAAQAEILNASGTEAALLENTTVRGQDAYVVRITPDVAALERVVANETTADLSQVTVRNATITQYVAHDDNRLLRSEIDLAFVQQGRLTTMTLAMTYSDYGDVPPITIPENDDGEPVCPTNASSSVTSGSVTSSGVAA